MIKTLLIGIWVSLVLSGSVYFFVKNHTDVDQKKEAASNYFGGLDYIKLEPVTVAIIQENAIKGYVILDIVFTIKQSTKAQLSVPVEYLLRDVVIGSVHGNSDIDIYRIEKFDLRAFQSQLLSNINNRFGEKIVYDVLVQKIDFISKEDIRDLQLRRS